MLTSRLRARVPSAQPIGTARLNGFELRFHKWSRDGSGKCNIVSSSGTDASVHGVVFNVDRVEIDALDEAEQRGRGYQREEVTLHGDPPVPNAFAYIAQPAYIDDALLPYDWYHALVVAGAREHDLPPAYIVQLGAVRSYPDPNEDRRRKHRKLLKAAGYPLLTR